MVLGVEIGALEQGASKLDDYIIVDEIIGSYVSDDEEEP